MSYIIDADKNQWTLPLGVALMNGGNAGFTANVTLLLWFGNKIYQQNNAGGWWVWMGNNTWAAVASDPRVTVPPPAPTPPPPAPVPPPPPAPVPVTLAWAPGQDGDVVSDTIQLTLTGTGLVNVEVFCAAVSPPMVARAVVTGGTRAVATLDTTKFPNAPLTLTAHAWNSAAGDNNFTLQADAGAIVLNCDNVNAPPAPPPPAPPPPPTPLPTDNTLFSDMVGLGVKFEQGQPLSELGTLIDLKVRWVRSDVWAATFNAATGVYTMSAVMQQLSAFCKTNNIGISALLQMGAATVPADFAKFAVEVAKALKATGVKFVLELGNEAHNALGSLGGNWQGKEISAGVPSPWVARYMQLLSAAADAVKAFDSTVKMLACDDMWICHYWFLQAGLHPWITGHAFHPYGQARPELAAVAWNTDWCQPFQCVDVDGSLGSAVRRLREQHMLKLGQLPEMWATEMGWAQTTEALAAQTANYVPRSFVLASEAGVDVMMWFSAQDGPDGPMGLKTNGLVNRPSYLAFRTMTSQLAGFKRAKRVAGASRPSIGVQAFVLNGALMDRMLVVWTADNSTITMASPSPTALSVVDVFGAPALNGTRVDITGAPTYFKTMATDAQLAAWVATL